MPSQAASDNTRSARLSLCCAALLTCALGWTTAAEAAGIAFRAATTSANGERAKIIKVDAPAGTVANDVMLAAVFVRGATADARKTPVVTAPAGWTLIRRDDHSMDGVVGGGASLLSYYRVATASEPATFTWTFDTDRLAVAGVASYSGVSTSSPLDGNSGAPSTAEYSKTIAGPSLTTTVPNAMVVGFFGLHEGAQVITAPAGMTERAQRTSPEPVAGTRPFASNLTFEIADESRAVAGATGKKEATSTYADTSIAQLIALKPAR
jgi:MSHA biogenesis protein MshQ